MRSKNGIEGESVKKVNKDIKLRNWMLKVSISKLEKYVAIYISLTSF